MEYTYSIEKSDDPTTYYWQASPYETSLGALKRRLGHELHELGYGYTIIIAECILINGTYYHQPIARRQYPHKNWSKINEPTQD